MPPALVFETINQFNEDRLEQSHERFELARFSVILSRAKDPNIDFDWEEKKTAKIINCGKADTIPETKSSSRSGHKGS